MRIRSPSLPELHAFVSVVEMGSFSLAAGKLAVTQGAVSRAVLRLEARLGVDLLDRRPGGVRPTVAGQNYYNQIHQALVELESAVPAKPVQPKAQLRVSVVSSLSMRWLVPRLPLWAAEQPHIHVAFKAYWIQDDFSRTDVDCWIQQRASSTSRWPRHILATYITGRDIVPICHPSVADSIRTPEDLLRFPLLHHIGRPGNWALWLKAQGVHAGAVTLGAGFDLAAGLVEGVCARLGVAVVQSCLIERELAEGRVVIPIPRSASTGRGYYFCVPRSRADLPAVVSFRDWLLQQAHR